MDHGALAPTATAQNITYCVKRVTKIVMSKTIDE